MGEKRIGSRMGKTNATLVLKRQKQLLKIIGGSLQSLEKLIGRNIKLKNLKIWSLRWLIEQLIITGQLGLVEQLMNIQLLYIL